MQRFKPTSITICVLLSLLLAGLIAEAAIAQAPPDDKGCKDFGLSAYSYFTDIVDGNIVLHFTFYNLSPTNGASVRIYAIDVQGVTPLKKPDVPNSDWAAKGHYFFETTSNPPSDTGIDPGGQQSGFTYYVDGTDISNLAIRMHFKVLSGKVEGTWDCSRKVEDEGCIKVEKTIKGNPDKASPGDTLTYIYKICNCGQTSEITSVNEYINGNFFQSLLNDFKDANVEQNDVPAGQAQFLQVGDCVTFEKTITVPQDYTGETFENCINVDFKFEGEIFSVDPVCKSVKVEKEACVEIIKKTFGNVTKGRLGEPVKYCYTIKNCGDFPLTIKRIEDTNPEITPKELKDAFLLENGGSDQLPVGASVTFCVKPVDIVETEPGKDCNTVTVTAQADEDSKKTVTDSDTFCIKILEPLCVSIDKSANKECATVGTKVIYTYKVCNCAPSDAGADFNITIASIIDKTTSPYISSTDITNLFKKANGNSLLLKPGKCVTFTREYTIKSTDVGRLCNTATVTLKNEDPVSDEWCIEVFRPVISVVKIANPEVAAVDDTITYTYTVCNITSEPVEISDVIDNNPAIGNLLDEFKQANKQQNGKTNMNSDILDPGECVTFTAQYKIKISDHSPLQNCVTVSVERFDSKPLIDGETGCFDVTTCAEVKIVTPEKKICFLPVTFTQQGWHDFCQEAPGVPGGMVYNKFPIAFARFGFFGVTYMNRVIIGAPDNKLAPGQHSMTFEAKSSALSQLCRFLPQTGPCDKLYGNYMNQSQLKDKFGNSVNNVLAGEVLALTLNIGYNDMRLMPRSKGYDLEKFIITQGLFKGKTVGYVLNVANAILAGVPPCTYGLPNPPSAGCNALVDVLKRINANYEFDSIEDFIDRGYLKPNVPLGQAAPPHIMIVPF